ncbi:hypothetical protein ACQ858_13395 [Variovorax ureilyticus]
MDASQPAKLFVYQAELGRAAHLGYVENGYWALQYGVGHGRAVA